MRRGGTGATAYFAARKYAVATISRGGSYRRGAVSKLTVAKLLKLCKLACMESREFSYNVRPEMRPLAET
jgi:hypothetical protein